MESSTQGGVARLHLYPVLPTRQPADLAPIDPEATGPFACQKEVVETRMLHTEEARPQDGGAAWPPPRDLVREVEGRPEVNVPHVPHSVCPRLEDVRQVPLRAIQKVGTHREAPLRRGGERQLRGGGRPIRHGPVLEHPKASKGHGRIGGVGALPGEREPHARQVHSPAEEAHAYRVPPRREYGTATGRPHGMHATVVNDA
mmetsp:Transcript_52990/g.129434  ORF Transcript_52990/g.129434 Transcript_52990/m.129434 type:complete len:201 (+) Transcript_52990:290-892(+)